ncbi:hypothetical protein MRX96_042529 [Rhipicephalus microplus]
MGPSANVQGSSSETPQSSNYQSGYSSGTRSDDKTTGNDEQPDFTENNGKGANDPTVIVPEFRSSSTPTPFTTKSTTQANTEEEITEGNTEEETEAPLTEAITDVDTNPTTTQLPTTPAKKDTWAGLICTIGTKLGAPEVLPDDRWCNYLFYDSVYKKGPAAFDPNHLDPALGVFMGHLSKYNYTAFRYSQHLKSELSTNSGATPVVLKHFFDENICNFGILDTPTDGLDNSSLQEMLEGLKLIDGFVKGKKEWPKKCRTFLAVPTPDTSLEDVYLKVFPPASLTTKGSYRFDLNSAAESIERLIARGMDATWALSISMKGRWTKLKAGQPVDFLSECEYEPSAESFGRYADTCEDPSFSNVTYYKSGVHGSLYYNKEDGRILAFENNTDIVQKFCGLRAQHLTFAYGVVAYDVDYEDYSDDCDSVSVLGKFTRVFTLTLLRDYVRIVFDVPKEYADCLRQDY